MNASLLPLMERESVFQLVFGSLPISIAIAVFIFMGILTGLFAKYLAVFITLFGSALRLKKIKVAWP